MTTLDQLIAQKQDELARLKQKKQKAETAEKVVIGGMILAVARKEPSFAKQLLIMINNEVNRESDKKRLEGIIQELKELANKDQASS